MLNSYVYISRRGTSDLGATGEAPKSLESVRTTVSNTLVLGPTDLFKGDKFVVVLLTLPMSRGPKLIL